jgi:hypothetical protein
VHSHMCGRVHAMLHAHTDTGTCHRHPEHELEIGGPMALGGMGGYSEGGKGAVLACGLALAFRYLWGVVKPGLVCHVQHRSRSKTFRRVREPGQLRSKELWQGFGLREGLCESFGEGLGVCNERSLQATV